MTDDAFLKLREFLDQFPLGYPKSPTGVEIKILKRLFIEEEANIAILLTHIPEEANKVAKRAGIDIAKRAGINGKLHFSFLKIILN